jgi:hypothetical protein
MEVEMSDKPTYKQIKFLMAIEEKLNIRCEGTSKKEVSDFISKHIDEFNHVKSNHKDEYDYWNNGG